MRRLSRVNCVHMPPLIPDTLCGVAGAAGGDETICKKLISKNQGTKGGYQVCSYYYFNQGTEGGYSYIAAKSDLECQQKCLETPNCIYVTRYKDAMREFPKKNCHIISLCGRTVHYADNTGCVQPNQPSCVYRQSMV